MPRIKKYTKNIKTIFSLILNRGLDSVVILIVTPYLLRIFGTSLYGELVFYLTIISFIQLFVIFGFENQIIYSTSKEKSNHSYILSQIFTIKFIIFIFFSIIYSLYCYISNDLIYPYLLLILPLAECFNFSHYFIVKNVASKLINISILRIFLFMALTLLIIKRPQHIEIYTIILGSSYLISVLMQNIYLRRKHNINLTFHTHELIPILTSSFNFFILKAFQLLSDKLYIIVIGTWLAYSFVSIADVAFKIYAIIIMPIQIIVISILKNFLTKKYNIKVSIVLIFLLMSIVISIPVSIKLTPFLNIYFFGYDVDSATYTYPLITMSAIFFIASFLLSELYLNPNGLIKKSIITSIISFVIPFTATVVIGTLGYLELNIILLFFTLSKMLDFLLKMIIYFTRQYQKC